MRKRSGDGTKWPHAHIIVKHVFETLGSRKTKLCPVLILVDPVTEDG